MRLRCPENVNEIDFDLLFYTFEKTKTVWIEKSF